MLPSCRDSVSARHAVVHTVGPAGVWTRKVGAPDCEVMETIPGLHPRALAKADGAADLAFYAAPRLVTHIDAAAIALVTALYRTLLPADGVVLDLMSSWVSHLPDDVAYGTVVGHGMNLDELRANPRLDRHIVQDLNVDPVLPLGTGSIDGACVCVGVQYLQRPVAVFRELRRVLRAGAPVVVTFSNRCFPTKAVAVWQAMDHEGHRALVSLYLARAGFVSLESGGREPPVGDPLWWVIGRATAA